MIAHAEQPCTLPMAHIVRRALTLPSGRLKEGVSVKEYSAVMARAQNDREYFAGNRRTHHVVECIEHDVLEIARAFSKLRVIDPATKSNPRVPTAPSSTAGARRGQRKRVRLPATLACQPIHAPGLWFMSLETQKAPQGHDRL